MTAGTEAPEPKSARQVSETTPLPRLVPTTRGAVAALVAAGLFMVVCALLGLQIAQESQPQPNVLCNNDSYSIGNQPEQTLTTEMRERYCD